MEDTKDTSLYPGTIHTTLSSYLARSKTTATTDTTARLLHCGGNETFVQIGPGLQSAVFEHITHPDDAIKKEHPRNAALRSNLANEAAIHKDVWEAFEKYKHLLTVPKDDEVKACGMKVPKIISYSDNIDDSPWKTKLNLFPEGSQFVGRVVVMERILPLTKEARRVLVEKFGEGSVEDVILKREENKHCLVRTYLGQGKCKAKSKMDEHGVSLRKFPLHLEGLKDMGVDVAAVAEAMGRAFAVMHWGAVVDGENVSLSWGLKF